MPNENESFFDPVDLAMFAGARSSVPLMSLLYSKEANAGTDYERFAQQRAYQMAIAERQRDEQMRRAMALREQQQLDARIPPEVQRFYINSRYDPATATRRADYETPPARNFGSPGTEMRAAPRRFQKGGKVAKTIREMADELLAKGAAGVGMKAGRGAGLSGVLGGGKTNIHPDILKATKSQLSSGLSAEQLAKSLGVSIEEVPNVLPLRESTKNLRKFVNPSTVQQRVFHGSNNPEGIVDDAQFAHYSPDSSEIHWFTPDPDFADQYTYKYMESPGEQGAIFPAYVQLQNPIEIPFDMNAKLTPDVWKFAKDLGFSKSDFEEWLLENDKLKPERAWNIIDSPQFREAAASRGYDGIKAPEGGVDTFGVFDPRKIKSQFNEGTYDTTTPDIGKKEGGSVQRFQKGGSARKTLQQMMDELLVRGTKTTTKDTPDIGRRALFGLRPQLDLPLAKIHPDIAKATESQITKALSPGKPGEPYISEEFAASLKAKGQWTPRDEKIFGPQLSRRALLTGAAGQAVRRMIPGLDSLIPSASDVVPELKGALRTVAGPDSTLSISEILPGLIAKYTKPTESGHWSGIDEGAVIKELGERGYSDPGQYKKLLNDYNFVDPESEMNWASLGALKRPFEHYQSIIDPRGEIAGRTGFNQSRNPLSYRPAMRQMREANPDLYKETLDSARQLTNNDIETVLENMRYGDRSRKAKDVYKSLDEWRKNKMSAQDLENKFPDFVDE